MISVDSEGRIMDLPEYDKQAANLKKKRGTDKWDVPYHR
jgi:hypothetical protein